MKKHSILYFYISLALYSVWFITIAVIRRTTPINEEIPFNKAYLDPGTGAMIISAIVGIFATIVLGLKTFWYKLASLFKPRNKQSTTEDIQK